jgi:hypothetical protein
MANGLESLVKKPEPKKETSASSNKEDNGVVKKTVKIAGDIWENMSPLEKAALFSSPIPVVGDIIGGAADISALIKDPSLTNAGLLAAGLLPFVPSGSVTRTAQKAFTNLRNDIPNFYATNNPVAQGLSWARTLPEGLGNMLQARYLPEQRGVQKEFNISVADQKAAKKALAVSERETENIKQLQEDLKKAKELKIKEDIDTIENDIKEASDRAKVEAKKAMGQLNQSRSMYNQYFGPEDGSGKFLKNIDEIDHIKTFSNFNVEDYYKTVGDLSGLPEEEIAGIFKQIEKTQNMNPNKNYQMNIRRAYTQSAGKLDPGMKLKVFGGKSLEDIKVEVFPTKINWKTNKIIKPKPYKDNEEFLTALQKAEVNVLNPEEVLKGKAAIVKGSGKTDAWELGGVNYMSSISKDGKVVTIVNDEHDLFSTPDILKKYFKTDAVGKLPGGDRYMNVSEPIVKELVKSKKTATTKKQTDKKTNLANQKKAASDKAIEEYKKISNIDISGPLPLGFQTREQWARVQAVANLKPDAKDYSRVKKEASIGFGIRAGKPLVRSAIESINLEEQQEEPVVQKRKRGGSVVERNPYNYTAKAI